MRKILHREVKSLVSYKKKVIIETWLLFLTFNEFFHSRNCNINDILYPPFLLRQNSLHPSSSLIFVPEIPLLNESFSPPWAQADFMS